ncbi:MAG: membrane protein insertion efficiency factor YidD [Deltaproteobacteria bacterium]|nr:membrane protein insertion efficiency factor YidD [Deltaproteobacteria bacterium]
MSCRMILIVILMVFCFPGPDFTKRAYADPFDMITGAGASERVDQQSHSENNVGSWLASFFSQHISAVDGDRCPSEPTCSSYSVQAFKKHGLAMGWLMTVDRLIHEGDEWSVSPVKNRGGKGKIIDPIENNDFWWYPGEVHSANR